MSNLKDTPTPRQVVGCIIACLGFLLMGAEAMDPTDTGWEATAVRFAGLLMCAVPMMLYGYGRRNRKGEK